MGYRLTLIAAVFLLGVSPPVFAAQWKQMTLPHFEILYTERDEYQAGRLFDALEEIRSRIVSDIGEVDNPPTKVYIVPSHASFQEVKPQGSNVPPWAAAVAYSRHNLIIIRSPRLLTGVKKDIVKTAAHETAHVLLGRAAGTNFILPRWLNEGFAMYEAKEWSMLDTTTMMWASITGSFYPFEQITTGFPEGKREAQVAYLQSMSMIAYLLDKYGNESFISFIRLLREQKNLNYSLKQTYGITMGQLENGWLKKIRLKYSWIPIVTGASTLWSVFALLLIAGYLRKRVVTKKKLLQWEKEEAEGRWMDFE